MAKHRQNPPQLGGDFFLTDGGLETTLVFHEKMELPCFAAVTLLENESGVELLRDYYRRYAAIAQELGAGFVIESVTWRANPDWGRKLGYSTEALADANRRAIELCVQVREELESPAMPMVISGCIGPQGDGYSPETMLSEQQAESYHREQIDVFAGTDADMVTAITMTYPAEAIGVTRAAQAAGIPAAIAFTVETDGRLPDGSTLREAILRVDEATGEGPIYYMINCAHPTHFADALASGEAWTERIRGLRANSSTKSHAELDEATELDEGDPADLAARHRELRRVLPRLNVIGGCCGTDHRHVAAIGRAWLS